MNVQLIQRPHTSPQRCTSALSACHVAGLLGISAFPCFVPAIWKFYCAKPKLAYHAHLKRNVFSSTWWYACVSRIRWSRSTSDVCRNLHMLSITSDAYRVPSELCTALSVAFFSLVKFERFLRAPKPVSSSTYNKSSGSWSIWWLVGPE